MKNRFFRVRFRLIMANSIQPEPDFVKSGRLVSGFAPGFFYYHTPPVEFDRLPFTKSQGLVYKFSGAK